MFPSIPREICTIPLEAGSDLGPGVRVEIADTVGICLKGFDPEVGPLEVTLTQSDGSVKMITLEPSPAADFAWFFTPFPGAPRGDYSFKVEQMPEGKAPPSPATGGFTVDDATQPRVKRLTSNGPPGAAVTFAFAGFPQNFDLYLYGPPEGITLPLNRKLASLSLDNGEGIYELTTDPGDGPGLYAIWSASCGNRPCATLTVTSAP